MVPPVADIPGYNFSIVLGTIKPIQTSMVKRTHFGKFLKLLHNINASVNVLYELKKKAQKQVLQKIKEQV